jgi:hypothetical protein
MAHKDITIDEVSDRLTEIDEQVEEALRLVETDRGSSTVLKAVVKQFEEKSKKTLAAIDNGDEESISEHVVEFEQAADSAKAAGEADEGISYQTRQAIIEAHDSVCDLKSELLK